MTRTPSLVIRLAFSAGPRAAISSMLVVWESAQIFKVSLSSFEEDLELRCIFHRLNRSPRMRSDETLAKRRKKRDRFNMCSVTWKVALYN